MRESEIKGLVERMQAGDRVALARLMTLVENRAPGLPELMSQVYPRSGRAHVIGITGPPGAGKSTLTDRITGHLRTAGTRVGIVAVDPSVIPLGTRMTIPGYGEGVAADTGSGVQGYTIDLWFPTLPDALAWGRRTVTITLH